MLESDTFLILFISCCRPVTMGPLLLFAFRIRFRVFRVVVSARKDLVLRSAMSICTLVRPISTLDRFPVTLARVAEMSGLLLAIRVRAGRGGGLVVALLSLLLFGVLRGFFVLFRFRCTAVTVSLTFATLLLLLFRRSIASSL
ncbi:MAG: hypothetical protein J3Q66DRAFT_350541 [Benniella sp.]|nr:MAG: hypothetical protein J3Q66DRAFT_350541 [Benniella sp.]